MTDEPKDPHDMSPGEIATKLWHVAKAEPLEISALMYWCGVACAALVDAQRALDGKDKIV